MGDGVVTQNFELWRSQASNQPKATTATWAQHGGAARSRVVGRRLVTLPRGRDRENRGSGRRWVTRRKNPSSIKLEGTAPYGNKTEHRAAETRQDFAREEQRQEGVGYLLFGGAVKRAPGTSGDPRPENTARAS